MDRRVLVAVIVVIGLVIGWFGLRYVRGSGDLGEGANVSGAAGEVAGESSNAPGETTPGSWTTQRRLRLSSGRGSPIGMQDRIPDIDFDDAEFPDQDEEEAMRLAEAELDPADPWPADYDGINGAIGEALGEIRECYDQWLALQPDLEGKVVVAFEIAAEDDRGVVTQTEVVEATTTENTFFEGCLLNVMSELQFEAPETTTSVNYPFVFSSE